MRVRLQISVCMEVPDLETAEEAMTQVQLAAHAALGSAAIPDEESNALARVI